MSKEMMLHLMDWLMVSMQVSILVPMLVVWRRRRHFSPTVKLLSWYVYLSALCAAGGRLYSYYQVTNYGFIIGFNAGKIALFGAIYHQALEAPPQRRAVVAATVVMLAGILGFVEWMGYTSSMTVTISRVGQCAVLAGFALAYLEQSLKNLQSDRAFQDPLWLLSVGQLLYSAGTVMAFSLDYLTVTRYGQVPKYIPVALAGLLFNWFLTLAFLRARPTQPTFQVVASSRPPSVS